MTILGVKAQLLSHFSQNDTFDPKKHAFDVVYDKETADHREEILALALNQLEELEIIKKVTKDESTIWILTVPINLLPQPVYLDRGLAIAICECINQYNQLDGIDMVCDCTDVNREDIERLLDIIQGWEDDASEDGGGEDVPQSPVPFDVRRN